MYNKVVIGVDQSYTRTGISIAVDGKLRKVGSTKFKGAKNKTEKRKILIDLLDKILSNVVPKANEVVVLCERIRTFSKGDNDSPKGHISISYIKATGALIGAIVDVSYRHGVNVYSVDTRSWKSNVVGTSKSASGDKKKNTINYVIRLGFGDSITSVNRKGETVYDDDAADSAGIALYGFIPKGKQKLVLET